MEVGSIKHLHGGVSIPGRLPPHIDYLMSCIERMREGSDMMKEMLRGWYSVCGWYWCWHVALLTGETASTINTQTDIEVAANRKLLSNQHAAANGVQARMRDKMAPRHVHVITLRHSLRRLNLSPISMVFGTRVGPTNLLLWKIRVLCFIPHMPLI